MSDTGREALERVLHCEYERPARRELFESSVGTKLIDVPATDACGGCDVCLTRAYVTDLEQRLAAAEARASKAELRTLSLYTPLWEYGYDCNDYEAQEIVGAALQEREALRSQLATAEAKFIAEECAHYKTRAEREELRAEVGRLQGELRLVTAPQEARGDVLIALRSRLAAAERVADALRKFRDEREQWGMDDNGVQAALDLSLTALDAYLASREGKETTE